MARVLLVSSDILPFPGLPTVGSGLRAWGLGQGLRGRGHEVLWSMPKVVVASREALIPPETVALAWENHNLPQVVAAARADVVVCCNWPIIDLLQPEHMTVPVALDQHGPHLLEQQFQNYGDPEDNRQRKLRGLRKADFFTCAGYKQLGYFQNWLTAAGWTEAERAERAAAIPVSLAPQRPARAPAAELTFVYGGVFLPWQDPSNGLFELVQALDRHGRGKLYFYGGKHPVYPVNTGTFDQLLDQLKSSPHVVTPGLVSHDALMERYAQAHVAIDLMARNAERELAFTTRTAEYLWCGLPVIYQDYAELSDLIREYQAGWTVDPADRGAIRAVFEHIFDHPEEVAARSRNAQQLAHERLNWDRTIDALDAFVRRPSIRPDKFEGQRPLVRDARYLARTAWMVLRQGGPGYLWREGLAFIQRQTRLNKK